MKLKIIFLSLLIFISACGGIKGKNYIGMKPDFNLEEYFNGDIKAWGIIQDRSGNVISRFDAEIAASWKGNKGILDETFTYYDTGKTEKRIWEITKVDDMNYEGSAGDIVGKASGKAYGNAIYWTYKMDVPVGNKKYRLKFDDWIWAMKDDVIVNRSYLKKFGITVAEITIFMQKQ